jgi:hypothetical protein
VGYGDISPVTPAGRAMTIVLALIGIGIFAIPAALLSSAFSDQLKMDREALVNKLFEMLSDGNIDEDEAQYIQKEAKRLHLRDEEVKLLIERAKRERDLMNDVSVLPLHKIASNTDHTIEHYKHLLGQVRQLSLLTDQEKFQSAVDNSERLTETDKKLWTMIALQQSSSK